MFRYKFINPFWEPVLKGNKDLLIKLVNEYNLRNNTITEQEYALLLVYLTFQLMNEPLNIFNLREITPANMHHIKKSNIKFFKSLSKISLLELELEALIFNMFVITDKYTILSDTIIKHYNELLYKYLITNKYINSKETLEKFFKIMEQRYPEYLMLLKEFNTGEYSEQINSGKIWFKVSENICNNEKYTLYNWIIIAQHYLFLTDVICNDIMPKYRVQGLKKYFVRNNNKTILVNEKD